MLIFLKPESTVKEIALVLKRSQELSLKAQVRKESNRVIVGLVGNGNLRAENFSDLPVIEKILPLQTNFKLSSREFQQTDTQLKVGSVNFGTREFVIMAGPCAVENRDMLLQTAEFLCSCGIKIMRAGAYKPRSSPYSFQGLKEEGLRYLQEAQANLGIKIITELVAIEHLQEVLEVADIVQVGARNMQNFALLEKLGGIEKPVLLKRGMNSTLEELLMAADYIIFNGNNKVLLCERGIRTFEKYTRNTFDISAIPLLKQLSHLPVIADPSHGTGVRSIVPPVARAALAAGADGLLLEVHPQPEKALSDGYQTLSFSEFKNLLKELRQLGQCLDRII